MKKKYLILIMALLLILAVSCTPSPQKKMVQDRNQESAIFDVGDIEKIRITVSKADVKSGCSDQFPTIDTLNKDAKIDVMGKFRDWYIVQLPNNKVGAVSAKDCKPIVVEENDTSEQPGMNQQPSMEQQPNINQDQPQTNLQPGTESPNAPNQQPENQTELEKDAQPNNTANLTSQERRMLDLVNKERAKNNLPAYQIDPKLEEVARLKSQDMIDNNYFSHNSPTYGSPFDMMKQFGIKFIYAGENIAKNTNIDNAHTSLMNSSGHRKNILSNQFTHIGIGIKKQGNYFYITQMFISKPK